MPERIRSLAARLNDSMTSLFSAPHRKARLPLTVSLRFERTTGNLQANHAASRQFITGFTQKMSTDEVVFATSVIRLGEYYLAGNEQKLHLEIELSTGAIVQMTAVATRYEQVELHSSVSEYVIEAKIETMTDAHRALYENFVRNSAKTKAHSLLDVQPERAKPSVFGQFFGLF
jgi:hypothetical protein